MNAIQKIKKLRAQVARPAQLLLKNSLKLSNKVSPEANAFVRGLKAKLSRTFGIDVLGIDTKSWSRQVVIDRFDFGTGDYGIRVTLPETYVNASRGLGAGDLLEILSSDSNLAQGSYLVVEEANTGDVAEGQARIVSGTVIRLADKTDEVAVAAVATLNLTADIVLTSVAAGDERNDDTFTLEVAAAAANPTNTILAVFTGDANDIICTITPNSGVNNPANTAAVGTLDLTADVVLTSVAKGTARNTNTLTLQVLAAAANPTDTVLVAFSGTSAAIVCTVTPNDGTNNSATAVNLTTAELVELINTGVVVGKTITLTDGSSFRALQTATGGGATALADSGEGDGVAATFAGGANVAVNLTTAQLAELINTGLVSGKVVTITDSSSLRALQTATGGGAQNLANSGEGDSVVATFADGEPLEFTSESDKIMKISFGIGTRAIY